MPLFTSPLVMNQKISPGVTSLISFRFQRRNISRAFAILAVAAGATQMEQRFGVGRGLALVRVLQRLGRCRRVMEIRVLGRSLGNQQYAGNDKDGK